MAGYNPLSYFSFGKKKDATSTSATPAPSGRGREGAHASPRGRDVPRGAPPRPEVGVRRITRRPRSTSRS